MSRDRFDVLERFEPLFEAPEASFEGFLRRRDRKRRNQRIGAATLGVAMTLALALGALLAMSTAPEPLVTPAPTPSVERVGFVGLPPEGAESTPADGELLYSIETSARDGAPFNVHVYVYTGGQMIWIRDGAPTGVPEGATDTDTGYLMQVLSPDGVEMLRAEILGTGLFEHDLAFRGDYGGRFVGDVGRFHGDSGLWLEYFDGRHEPITLSWYRGPERFDGKPTLAQREDIGRLVDRLADPEAWLPATAWEDREIRPFVASTYTVMVAGRGSDTTMLPPPANQLLENGKFYQCVTTAEARRIVEAFDAAGTLRDDSLFAGGISFLRGDHISVTPSLKQAC